MYQRTEGQSQKPRPRELEEGCGRVMKSVAVEASFCACLTKPVEIEELVELLGRYLPSTNGVVH